MRSFALCGAFLALALFGCSSQSNPYSSSVYAVSGKVLTPGGEPVRGGTEVTLVPKAKAGGVFGREGAARVGSDGTFKVKSGEDDGVPGGFYLVVVRPYGTAAERQTASAVIPKKYWSEDTSDLTVEITADKTNWDIKLSK